MKLFSVGGGGRADTKLSGKAIKQRRHKKLLLFEKDGCLISKAVQKICLLSKQISASVLAKCV